MLIVERKKGLVFSPRLHRPGKQKPTHAENAERYMRLTHREQNRGMSWTWRRLGGRS